MRTQELTELMSQLDALQKDWSANIDEIKAKSQLIDRLSAQEESFWQQRS